LLEKYPEEKIYLLGSGKLHHAYAENLLENIKSVNLINMVNKTNLKEAFNLIARSRLFIGFDSGLYNLAFTLRKPTIVLFRSKENGFAHEVPWVKVLLPQKNIDPSEIKVNSIYSNKEINSISKESFREALESWKEI
ncbi:MAG: glycosyltransferase family 9 protein, partial [Fusobacteriaceae bacterium]